ncbi:MAG TPA: anaerobic ribonucleoside-triphosphate reductase activating protein [Desulfobacteria bacterium]|nr:anaerobic ribonucleoside-triphosphate reductase activating protein [Desulfobacteria bacterium]
MATVNLGGIVSFSTIDWRGKAAMVIFLSGCPLRCIYCQNSQLLEEANSVDAEEIEAEITKSKDFIDAVVLSGGEPFMQPHAVEAIARFAKKHALLVAAQTCGFYPSVVESMLKKNLIDKIFLDIKAPLADEKLYEGIARASGVAERVKSTLEVCIRSDIDLEIVTTVFKNFVGLEEVKRIAVEFEEAGAADSPFVIQQGRPELVPEGVIRGADAFSHEELKGLAFGAYQTAHLKEVRIRTREAGEEVIYGGTKDGKRFS